MPKRQDDPPAGKVMEEGTHGANSALPEEEDERGPLRVLLVEDCEDDALLLVRELKRGGYEVQWKRVETAAGLRAALLEGEWHVVLADWSLPRFTGSDALKIVRESGCDLPFIIVSGMIGEETAVAALRAGAHDFLTKGNLVRLLPAVGRELREAEIRRQRRQAIAAREEEAAVADALVRVGRQMLSSLNTPELLERLCQVTTSVLACDSSYTLLRSRAGDRFAVVAAFGEPPERREALQALTFPLPIMHALLLPLEEHGLVHGGEEMADPVSTFLFQRCGVRRVLYTRLAPAGELFGIHVAASRRSEEWFTRCQERIATGLTQIASMALLNARLFEELERANRLKSEFVATMSHELRTPLHIIMGYNGILRDGGFGPVNPEQEKALERVHQNARQLLSLIEATLDLSRLEAGKMTTQMAPVDLIELVAEIEAETRALLAKPGVQFVCRTPACLRPVLTDRVKLKVILQNLLDNAFKFTAAGSVGIVVQEQERGVEIVVMDTGSGIPADRLEEIFEPFRQLDATDTRKYSGVGLGLHVVRRLLDLLGGTVSVESEPGLGSCFRVCLPYRPRGADSVTGVSDGPL